MLSDVALAELALLTCFAFGFVFSESESESDESDDDDEDEEHNLVEIFIHWNIPLEDLILHLWNIFLDIITKINIYKDNISYRIIQV